MRKITLLTLLIFCFGWQLQAQFTESFETEIPGTWTIRDEASASAWVWNDDPAGGAQEGAACASISFATDAHDDYLITPAIVVTAAVNDRLSFWVRSRSSSFLEPYEVLLSTSSTEASDFTEELQEERLAPINWSENVFDLTSYVGQTVYVAVRATGQDEFELFVDNFINDGFPICNQPSATASVVDDCANNQFSIEVDITDLGDATSLAISNDGGVAATTGITSTGIVTVGPFAENTPVNLLLEHEQDSQCDVDLGGFNFDCPTIVDCSSQTPVNVTFCYDNSEVLQFPFTSSDGNVLRASFAEGYFEDCCDVITIYDGLSTSDAVLFESDSDFDNDATGIEAISTGDSILVEIVSDSSISCGDASGSPDLSLNVSCVSSETADFFNLQFPASGSITTGGEYLVFAQIYEAGLTDASSDPAAGIESWIGYSTTDSSPDTDADWTWVAATPNPGFDFGQNNDEYFLDLGGEIPSDGTYYYASRWRLLNGPFTYGGILPDGSNGGEWGTNGFGSGVLTVTDPPPPDNDACADATVVGSLPFNDAPDATFATNNDGFIGTCSFGMNDGIWYTFTPTVDGTVDIVVDNVVGWDPELALYSGSCGAFVCEDSADGGGTSGAESLLNQNVQTGVTYFINVGYWSGSTDASEGPFTIDISGSVTLSNNTPQDINFSYYPNPTMSKVQFESVNNIERITAINMLGQTVLDLQPNSLNPEFDMSSLQTGTYFLRVSIGDVTETVRVIKQ